MAISFSYYCWWIPSWRLHCKIFVAVYKYSARTYLYKTGFPVYYVHYEFPYLYKTYYLFLFCLPWFDWNRWKDKILVFPKTLLWYGIACGCVDCLMIRKYLCWSYWWGSLVFLTWIFVRVPPAGAWWNGLLKFPRWEMIHHFFYHVNTILNKIIPHPYVFHLLNAGRHSVELK